MIFQPRINHTDAVIGRFAFDVANEDGVWLGVVRIDRRAARYEPADGIWLSQAQLIRLAKFIAEKLDEK